jgi:hypothetical protein
MKSSGMDVTHLIGLPALVSAFHRRSRPKKEKAPKNLSIFRGFAFGPGSFELGL